MCKYQAPGSFLIDSIEIPQISSDEILVKTKYVGVCGTDIHKAVHQTVPRGTILGHEISGIVEAVGDEVTTFAEGDNVAIAHHAPCMSCKQCLKGHHSLCEQYLKTNVYPGGFAEYIRLPRENVKHTVKLMPDGISFQEAAFMEPLACCLRGFHRLSFDPGDTYLIIGLGPIGMLFCQIARAFNAKSIIGIEINKKRVAFAVQNSIVNAAFNPRHGEWSEFKFANNIKNFDHIIISVGLGPVYQDALHYISHGSNLLFFAECPDGQSISIEPNLVYRNELTILGSYSSSPRFLTMALNMIASGRINVAQLITHEFGVDHMKEALETAAKGEDSLKVMIKF